MYKTGKGNELCCGGKPQNTRAIGRDEGSCTRARTHAWLQPSRGIMNSMTS